MDDQQQMLCCPPEKDQNGQEFGLDDSPVVEQVIGKVADLPPGTKKAYDVNGRQILVINDNDQLFAINAICSHYKGDLSKGVYNNGKIRCPLHGACFNVKTGDIEDYPGFDSLHSFKVKKVGEDLVIYTTEKQLSSDRRVRKPKFQKCNDIPIVVIGSGPSAQSFVEHARLNGCPTPILMITDEQYPPYDRVQLSKAPHRTGQDLRMGDDEWYKERSVEIKLNSRVSEVKACPREVVLENGDKVPYSKLVIATGGTVRKLAIPGSDLKNIFYLRQVQQANAISAAAVGKDVVCIGASFIGMEIAGSLADTARSVTVISITPEPLPALGTDVGGAIRKRFEEKGVRFFRNASAIAIHGNHESSVREVELDNGANIPADMVVAGIGILPTTEFLKSAPIELDKRGFILVDKKHRTNSDYIYAIGDVTSAPVPLWEIENTNIQHFQVAQMHGKQLAHTIVGKPVPKPLVPTFWATFFKQFGVRFAGVADGHNETLVRGDVDALNFIKYYFKNQEVVAIATSGQKTTAMQFMEIFQKGRIVTKAEVERNTEDKWDEWM